MPYHTPPGKLLDHQCRPLRNKPETRSHLHENAEVRVNRAGGFGQSNADRAPRGRQQSAVYGHAADHRRNPSHLTAAIRSKLDKAAPTVADTLGVIEQHPYSA